MQKQGDLQVTILRRKSLPVFFFFFSNLQFTYHQYFRSVSVFQQPGFHKPLIPVLGQWKASLDHTGVPSQPGHMAQIKSSGRECWNQMQCQQKGGWKRAGGQDYCKPLSRKRTNNGNIKQKFHPSVVVGTLNPAHSILRQVDLCLRPTQSTHQAQASQG